MQLHHGDKSHCRQKFGQRRRAGRWEWQAGHWRCSRGNKNQNELVIAVVKNGRTVYLQPAVKLPLVRFMPTLGPQRQPRFFFFCQGHANTLHTTFELRRWMSYLTTDFGNARWAWKINQKGGRNCLQFASPHVEHVYTDVCIFFIINARECVCVAHPFHLPPFLSGSHHPWWRVINTLVTPLDNGSKYALSYKGSISASLAPVCLPSLWVMLLI